MSFVTTLLLASASFVPQGGESATAPQPFSAVGSAPPAAMHGIWQSRGYGWVVEVSGVGLRAFDHGPAGTIPHDAAETAELLQGMQYRVRGDVLEVTLVPGMSSVHTWDRIDALPPTVSTPPAKDPRSVFEYLCTVMGEHYAYFELRGVDWTARCAEHRSKVRTKMTEAELWEVCCALLRGFGDAHLSLRGNVAGEEKAFSEGDCRELFPALRHAYSKAQKPTTKRAYQREWLQGLNRLVREELLGGEFQTGAFEQGVWGKVGEVGYVSVRGMGGFDESEDPRDEVRGVHRLLGKVLTELADCKGLVLDITLNSGGYDEVQMAIASHFTDRRRPAFRKIPLDAKGRVVKPQTFYLEPAKGPRFTGPIALVTSDYTVSAGEDFTLAMRELPHVTHVGSRTRGAFSDILEKALPNGWKLGLSNEAYLDLRGTNYESTGVAPEVEIPIFVLGAVHTSHAAAIRRIVDTMTKGGFGK